MDVLTELADMGALGEEQATETKPASVVVAEDVQHRLADASDRLSDTMDKLVSGMGVLVDMLQSVKSEVIRLRELWESAGEDENA